jgi:uncharacterized protein (TIGR02145 family)
MLRINNCMKIILNLTVVMIIVLITSACGYKTPPKIVKEPKTPDVMVIGSQTWTTKNLDVATFRNGDVIPEAKTNEEWEAVGKNKQAAWCYYENNPENGTKYGKLYNWYAVNDTRGLAKAGWHIPTDEELTKLSDYLGGEQSAREKMKNSSGWKDGNGNNSSGFTGLPGGCRYDYGSFSFVGYNGNWWSASEADEMGAWYRALYDDLFADLDRDVNVKGNGFSVRCVKD